VAFYADPSKDPHQGQYARVMQGLALLVANEPPAVQHQELLRSLLSDGQRVPAAFLFHVQHPNAGAEDPGHIQLYHRAVMYPGAFNPPLPWDNRVYAFRGDVYREQMPPSVCIPEDALELMPTMIVPNDMLLLQDLAQR
jgi:hypothetical protein